MDDCFEDAPAPMDPASEALSDSCLSPEGETTPQDPPVIDEAILREYDKAFYAFLRGNHGEASRVMAEALPRNDSSAIFHLMSNLIHAHLAMSAEDPDLTQEYRNTAVESARRAIRIAPQLLSVTLFYAHMLYLTATCSEDYKKVVQECEFALSVPHPDDSGWAIVEEGFQAVDNTPEARISCLHNMLRFLMQKAKVASNSRHVPILGFPAPEATVQDEKTKPANTGEENRKEIEAQLLQLKLMPSVDNDDTSSGASRRAQRCKLNRTRKLASSLDRSQPTYDYWKSMEPEKRESFLEIAISDLKYYFSNSKFKDAYAVLTEALSYAEEYQSWKFWLCCECNAKFLDSDSLAQHFGQNHTRSLPPNLQSVLPQELDGELAQMIISGSWKPVDMEAAARMLEKERLPLASEIISNGDSRSSDGSPTVLHKWPLSNDTERSVLLQRIRSVLESLLKRGCLSAGHFNMVMQFTVNELQGHPPSSQILGQAVNRSSPMTICFLGAFRLRKLLQFLQELAKSCEFEERRGTEDTVAEDDNFPEEKFLSWDSAKLRLDKHYFARIFRSAGSAGEDCLEDFLPWLFFGPSLDEQMTAWAQLRDDKCLLAKKLLFLAEFYSLRTECEKKCERLGVEEALEQARRLVCEIAKREDDSVHSEGLSYRDILLKRTEDLPQENTDCRFGGRYVADIILKVLEDAKTLWFSYFQCRPREEYSPYDDEVKAWDSLYVSDNCVVAIIQRVKDQESWELGKIDARISHYMSNMRSYGSKLGPALAFDYRPILVPLMKAFMRSRLEVLAEEYAIQKSDAAREAFLAELASDEKNNVKGSEKRSKATPEKSKDKRKKRQRRKSQDTKALDERAKTPSLPEEEEKSSVYTLVRTPSYVHRLPVSSPYLNEEDEDPIRVELEVDAKSLEEAKGCQRKVEKKTTQRGVRATSLRRPKGAGQNGGSLGDGERKAEEQFQRPDVERGVCGGLGSSRESLPKYVPVVPTASMQKFNPVDGGRSSARSTDERKPGKDFLGEYNCFLNALIQTLWHLRRFLGELLRSLPGHSHLGYPCVVCALQDVFASLDSVSAEGDGDAISAACLRTALRNLFPDTNLFQEINDAAGVLATIFDCIHHSFAGKEHEAESKEKSGFGSWDCSSSSCVAHRQFGWDVLEKVHCSSCGVESRHLKYSSFFHDVSANDLRKMKDYWGDRSLDELLRLVEMEHQLSCDPEAGGCGKLNHIRRILDSAPKIFTVVLGWKNARESEDEISATLDALSPELDVAILYHGLEKGEKHSLVCMVCCLCQQYFCIAHRFEEWVMYDGRRLSVIGQWGDVLSACKRGRLQPQILFFEPVE